MNRVGKPLVVITMGDAAGIGPEIIVKALGTYRPQSTTTLVVGSYPILRRAADIVGSPVPLHRLRSMEEAKGCDSVIDVLDLDEPSPEEAPFGSVSAASGRASVEALRRAYQLSLEQKVKAIVSAPLHKQAIKEAGFSYNDECELMADLTGAPTPMMLLMSDKMRMTTLYPLHLPLREACENVKSESVQRSLEVLHQALASFGVPDPVIAVAALNPHAGEGGSLGQEEVREIVPAIEATRRKGWDIRGPFPADSLFFAASKGAFDAVLTMYHDQGRIAMKTIDFGRIVIAMIGIGIRFLTVAHGTGYDIAGKGVADPGNFVDALRFADEMA